jgi:D-xylose transport system permease protein
MKTMLKKSFLKINIESFIMIISLIGIAIIFSILSDGTFLLPRNISNLARQTTVAGILSIGMMFVIVAGHIDLSVGSLLGFCGTLAAVLQVWNGWATGPTIAVVLIAGVILGSTQGFWVSYLRVPAFIVTLGGLLVFKGMKLGLSKSVAIAPMRQDFSYIGQGYLSASVGWIVVAVALAVTIFTYINKRRSRIKFGFDVAPIRYDVLKIAVIGLLMVAATHVLNAYRGIPVPVLLLLILAFVFNLIALKTVYGRSVYSIGGNLEAADLAGIRTKLIVLIVFTINGLFSALAGIVLTARLDSATTAAGDSMELDAIASCVIGGTSMSGGMGRVPGVLIGALVMSSLNNGMSLINLENFWQFIVKGIVLVLAVWIDTATGKKK